MPKIITVANQKGGVGKSTLSLCLHDFFVQNGKSVLLVDSDAQKSLQTLLSRLGRDDIDIRAFQDQARAVTHSADIAIIDTPPYLSKDLPGWFAVSDFVLIPVCPGPFDALASQDVIELLKQAQKLRPGIKAGVVFNRVINRTSFTGQIKDLIEGFGVPILNTQIHNRVEYARGLLTEGVQDEKARNEIGSLAGEILTATL